MITESFFVRADRLVELQQYIKENMPTCRFSGNPIKLNETYSVTVTYEIGDVNKLTVLHNRWYDSDNVVIETPTKSWIISKIRSWFRH